MTDPSDLPDLSDPDHEREQRDQERAIKRADLDVMRGIMRTKNGRAWLARKLVEWHLQGEEFYPGQSDMTAFRLGEKNCARRLEEEAKEASFDQYMMMLKEQIETRKVQENSRREKVKERESLLNPTANQQGMDLPPPAGWPGGPALPETDKGTS